MQKGYATVLLILVLLLGVSLVGCGGKDTVTVEPTVTTAGPDSTAIPTETTSTSVPTETTTGAPTDTTMAPSDKVVELRFANYFTGETLQGKLWEQFCKDIEARSNGQIKITYYHSGTLFTGEDTVDGIKNRVADMGYITTGHYPGRFPISEALAASLGFTSAWVAAHVAQDFQREYHPDEWSDFRVLVAGGQSPQMIISKKPVRTLKDFKGNKARSRGKVNDVITLLGGSPVSLPAGDTYDGLSKGVIDSAVMSLEAAKSWRLGEVCKYITRTWQAFPSVFYYVIMNRVVYDGLPDDVKQAIDEVSAEYVEKAAAMTNDVDMEAYIWCKENGVEMIDLSPEDAAEWAAISQSLTESYVKDMVAAGHTDADIQGWLGFIQERIQHWTQEQANAGIKSPMGPAEILVQ